MKKGISIIVLSSNNPEIALCISILLEQKIKEDEIIIVDDYSKPNILRILRNYEVREEIKLILANTRGNRSKNRNLGSQYAKNGILLFMDGDMLLCENSLDVVRRAHMNSLEIAFIGARHGTKYSPDLMKLYSGIDNYNALIHDSESRKFIYDYPLFEDRREKFFQHPEQYRYYWVGYYTCCCTVEKWAFEHAGGFDENFHGWGAEDVDFGYRISKFGRIGYLSEFGGLHVPHPRKTIQGEWSNYINIGYMLKKYRRWEFEVLQTYCADPQILYEFELFIERMGMIPCVPLELNPAPNTLYLEAVSRCHPNGRVLYYNNNIEAEENHMIGISLPFSEHEIETVYLSGGILAYPQPLVCNILQEALRIGRKVLLDGETLVRLDWKESIHNLNRRPQYRCCYLAHDISEFSFSEEGGKLRVYSSILSLTESKPIFPEIPPVHVTSAVYPHATGKTYCVIDFTVNYSGSVLEHYLTSNLSISILGRYHYILDEPMQRIWVSEMVLGNLLSIRQPILFLCQDISQFQTEDTEWITRKNPFDIIADCQGKVLLKSDLDTREC